MGAVIYALPQRNARSVGHQGGEGRQRNNPKRFPGSQTERQKKGIVQKKDSNGLTPSCFAFLLG